MDFGAHVSAALWFEEGTPHDPSAQGARLLFRARSSPACFVECHGPRTGRGWRTYALGSTPPTADTLWTCNAIWSECGEVQAMALARVLVRIGALQFGTAQATPEMAAMMMLALAILVVVVVVVVAKVRSPNRQWLTRS